MESLLGEPKIESNIATNRDMSNEIIDFFSFKYIKIKYYRAVGPLVSLTE